MHCVFTRKSGDLEGNQPLQVPAITGTNSVTTSKLLDIVGQFCHVTMTSSISSWFPENNNQGEGPKQNLLPTDSVFVVGSWARNAVLLVVKGKGGSGLDLNTPPKETTQEHPGINNGNNGCTSENLSDKEMQNKNNFKCKNVKA